MGHLNLKALNMKIFLISITAAFAGSISSAVSEEFDYVGDNHSWSLLCNQSGYVMRSQFPVSRFHEAGANSKISNEIETLYLGRSCDAKHSVLVAGSWCWANGGFVVELERQRIGFPRQELQCPVRESQSLGCQC